MKNKSLQSECDTLRSECDTLRSECDTLQSECDKLTELQAETGKLRTENIELQTKCNTLNEVIDKIAASNKSSAPTSPSVEEKHFYYTPHQLEPVQDTLLSECDTKDRKKMEEHNEVTATCKPFCPCNSIYRFFVQQTRNLKMK